MTRNALQIAMNNVDDGASLHEVFPANEAVRLLAANEAAAKAEAAAEAIVQAEQDEAETAAEMALAVTAARDEAWKDAQGAVNRAMIRGGRDPVSPLSTDTRALRSIAELLIFVQETKGEATDAETLAAFKRGQAVAKALAGQ